MTYDGGSQTESLLRRAGIRNAEHVLSLWRRSYRTYTQHQPPRTTCSHQTQAAIKSCHAVGGVLPLPMMNHSAVWNMLCPDISIDKLRSMRALSWSKTQTQLRYTYTSLDSSTYEYNIIHRTIHALHHNFKESGKTKTELLSNLQVNTSENYRGDGAAGPASGNLSQEEKEVVQNSREWKQYAPSLGVNVNLAFLELHWPIIPDYCT